MKTRLVVYVDVDDTLIRAAGTKQMPIKGVIEHVRRLLNEGAQLFCWSTGGAEYAKSIAMELGIAECFSAFLPKPDVLLDDQTVADWRRTVEIHPLQCSDKSCEDYRKLIAAR